MFVEDYRELKIDGAEKIAERCFLFEKFVDELLESEPEALRFKERETNVAIHAHCHAKSITKTQLMQRLVERLPGRKVTLPETGCCGMAGAFGYEAEHYEVSMKMAERSLLPAVRAAPAEALILADGTSCRHQIADGSGRRAEHVARIFARALGEPNQPV